ncbi:MAG: hypothetical protein IJ867_01735 [Clostridia bacterium]|nr:hypothetical protein [Clostridia bacterium]
MQKIIGDFTEKSYSDYVECNGVWGITEDLKIYYCGNGLEDMYHISNIILGKEKGDSVVFSSDSDIAKLLNGDDPAKSITIGEIRNQTILNLDDSIDNLNDLYNFTALEKLVLNNMTLESLDGLEYNTNLKSIFIQKTTIGNYSTLAKLSKLEHIYFYMINDEEIRRFCDTTIGIGGKDLNALTHLGIYGAQHFIYLYNNDKDQYSGDATTHSEVTNISYLNNLSSKTKENITHLYLNNNKIENVDNLYEFINLKMLRLERNEIISLEGIYNPETEKGITKIEYLFVRGNKLGYGIEGDSIDPDQDALKNFSKVEQNTDESYHYSKLLNKIDRLDLGLNTSLKYIDYIQTCSTINYLWLDGCTMLSNSSVLATAKVINGAEIQIDDGYAFYLASSDDTITRFEIGSRTMTTKEFDDLFKNKTQLYRLKLDGLVFVDKDGEPITNYNTEINATLAKLSSIKFLSVYGLSGITSLDFLEIVGGTIRQLDLRGTMATDMDKINDYCPKIVSLAIDYGEIDTKELQGVWDRCSYNYTNAVFGDGKTYDSDALFDMYDCGIFMQNADLINQTKDWTDITTMPDGHNNKKITDTAGVWDFRNCENFSTSITLKSITWGNIYLPTHVEYIGSWGRWVNNWEILNLEDLTSVHKFYSSSYNTTVKNLINQFENLDYLELYWCGSSFSLSDLDNPENFEYLYLYEYLGSQETGIKDESLKDLGKFINLKDLRVYYQKNITKIPDGIEKCTKLEHLEMWNTNISSLYPLRNLSELNYLRVNNTPMYETGFFRYDDGIIINDVDNMQILADLYSKKLRTIMLAGTNITDFSKISGSGFNWNANAYRGF